MCALNKMTNSKTSRFKQEVWEYTLPGKADITTELKRISGLKYGSYQCWGIHHTKDEETHTHICVALRTRPCFSSATLNSYFQLPAGSTPPQYVKTGRGKLGKLNGFYKYCTDTDRHKDQIIGDLVSHDGKFIPDKPGSSPNEKPKPLGKGALVLKAYVEEGLSVDQQYQRTDDWNFKFYLMDNRDKLNQVITNHKRMVRAMKPPEFPMASFTDTPIKRAVVDHDFSARALGCKKQGLILKGKSNTGKTKIAKARFTKPLVVRHRDKLKAFDPCVHDGIVFDDMSFAHYPRESVLALLDMDDDADIDVKNSMVTIPAGFPRIFTTNRELYATNANGEYDKDRSFLPAPLHSSGYDEDEIIQPLESGNSGAFGAIGDSAMFNRFKCLTVNDKLYA